MRNYRGHRIKLDEETGKWVYADTGESMLFLDLPSNADWCGRCGRNNTPEGHDGCLGTLPDPDVMNACCGHGDTPCAYVQFWTKPRIAGEDAMEYFEEHVEDFERPEPFEGADDEPGRMDWCPDCCEYTDICGHCRCYDEEGGE